MTRPMMEKVTEQMICFRSISDVFTFASEATQEKSANQAASLFW